MFVYFVLWQQKLTGEGYRMGFALPKEQSTAFSKRLLARLNAFLKQLTQKPSLKPAPSSQFTPMRDVVSRAFADDGENLAREMLLLELEEGASVVKALKYVISCMGEESFATKAGRSPKEISSFMRGDTVLDDATVNQFLSVMGCELKKCKVVPRP